MTTLTAAQSRRIADGFREMSKSIGAYAKGNPTLPKASKDTLTQAREDLLIWANRLLNQAVRLEVDDVKDVVARVEATSAKLNETITKINNAKRAIEIATLAVQIVTAAGTGNAGGVLDALDRADALFKARD